MNILYLDLPNYHLDSDTLYNNITRPDGNKDWFSELDLISTKEGQRSRSRSNSLLHFEEGYPIKQLTKYGSDPMRIKENIAV